MFELVINYSISFNKVKYPLNLQSGRLFKNLKSQ